MAAAYGFGALGNAHLRNTLRARRHKALSAAC
jgi:hypothetical protein